MVTLQAKHDRITRVLAAIKAHRRHYREYPLLNVVTGRGKQVVQVLRGDDGQDVRVYGRQLAPEYADRERCILSKGAYRRALLVLIRRQHHFKQCLARGVEVWTTHRSEEYAWENIEDFSKRNLQEAMWDAAQLLDRTFTPRDIYFRKFTPGTTIAAAARITVTTADGAVRSDMQYSQDLLRTLGYEEGDTIQVSWDGEPPACILVVENDAAASELVGWLIAKRCNLLVVGVHGWVERQENYLVWTLAGLPELQDVDVLVISDLDMGGLRINKSIRVGDLSGSHDAPSYGVPRAKRIGITAEQFVQGCDGCLQRRLGATSVKEAKNMVARSKDPQFADELDEQTLRDARWIAESGCGAHFESLQFPAPDADRPAGRFGAAMFMEKSIMQRLNLPL